MAGTQPHFSKGKSDMRLIGEKSVYDHFVKAEAASPLLLRVKAPGRMNLIGEHTDYNGGKVLPFAINRGISLTCRRLSSQVVPEIRGQYVFTSGHTHELFVTDIDDIIALGQHGGPKHGTLYTSHLDEGLRKSWACYAMGALHHLAAHAANDGPKNGPLWIHVESDLPVGAGISSSAALSAGLLATLFTVHGKPFVREEAARQAMLIEHHFIGTKCGLMDQLAVLCAEQGHLLMVDFADFPRHHQFSLRHVKAHDKFADYQLVGLNTGVKHNLSDSPYNERRAACENMVELLNKHFSTDHASLGEFALAGEANPLRRVMGGSLPQNKVRDYLRTAVLHGRPECDKLASFAAHAICENERVDTACAALLAGDVARLDHAMEESHLSLQHDYQVSCEELDAIKKYAREKATELGQKKALGVLPIIGPRMTGGGFGGSTIQMVHTGILEQFTAYFSSPHNAYTQRTGIEPKTIVTPLGAGLTMEAFV